MAQPFLTAADVYRAAEDIAERGDRPTGDAVRGVLGRGSMTTITRHLRQWRAARSPDAAELPELPAEVRGAMRGLWESACEAGVEIANRHVQALRERLHADAEAENARALAAQASTDQARHDAQRANERAALLEAQRDDLQQARDELGRQLRAQGDEHARALADAQKTQDTLRQACREVEAAVRAQQQARLDAEANAVETRAQHAEALRAEQQRYERDTARLLQEIDAARTGRQAAVKEADKAKAAVRDLDAALIELRHRLAVLDTQREAAETKAREETTARVAIAADMKALRDRYDESAEAARERVAELVARLEALARAKPGRQGKPDRKRAKDAEH